MMRCPAAPTPPIGAHAMRCRRCGGSVSDHTVSETSAPKAAEPVTRQPPMNCAACGAWRGYVVDGKCRACGHIVGNWLGYSVPLSL